jgi:dihydroorotate dehydrogenase electron transfer subunit
MRSNKDRKKIVTGKLISKTQVAAGHFQMEVLCPYIAHNTTPGQFIQVRISNSYDPLLCRPFAAYRINGDIFEILFKVVGRGTRLLSEKIVGDELFIIGPLGNGFPVDEGVQSPILVAGGMGIAALMPLAETMNKHQVTVLIGAAAKSRIVGERELRDMGLKVHLATEDGSAGYRGMVSELLCEILESNDYRSDACCIYACGPMPMLKSIAKIAARNDATAYVSLEERMACGVGACMGCACRVISPEGEIKHKMVCTDGPVFNAQEILWE